MPKRASLTIVTCLRDEGPFIVEWVAHLRALGVDRILAVSNDCSDGTEALLDALAPAGVVHLAQGAVRDAEGPTPQWRALRQAWDHPVVAEAEWLAHLDCDEFLAVEGGDLPALLDGVEGDAIAIPWRLFGCAGRLAPGEGTTPERFPRAAPGAMVFPAQGNFFKTLFRRDGPWSGFGIHRPRQTDPARFVDDRLAPCPDLGAAPNRILLWRADAPEGRVLQLNHYSVRSVHEFLVKRGRGLPNRTQKPIDLAYWVERNFNQTECTKIAPQVPGIVAGADALRALPGVTDAEAAARAWHGARLAEILATPEGAKLCGQLVLAAGSVPPPEGLGRAILAQYQAAMKGET